jgi:hypothetical protein
LLSTKEKTSIFRTDMDEKDSLKAVVKKINEIKSALLKIFKN